jgi:GTPase SAR1 family protein
MSVPEFEKLEFRICFIGEDDVGKKTLLNRFKNMKATDTIEFPSPAKKKITKVEKQTNKPCNKKEIVTEVSKIRTRNENLANFTKVIRIERNFLEFNFYLVPAAEKVVFSDNLNEEDEAEKLHKMKFWNVRNYFKDMLAKPSKDNISIRYIFLFMFDITIDDTYQKAKVYYDEINKITNFQKNLLRNFFPILIGNKIDLKYPYEAINREELYAYIKEKNIRFYETSGKLYFNFENFFQKFFFDLFENEYPAFSTQIFKDRFSDATENVKTIPISPKRSLAIDNGFPGPTKYQTNIYDLISSPGILLYLA